MGIVSGLVLFVIIWAMVFLIALPIRVQTQGDLGDIVEGTHAGAPEHHHMRKKALWTTVVAFVIWGICAAVILSGVISVGDLERWMHRPSPVGGGTGG